MARVSTRRGDDGFTDLWGSGRVAKYAPRPELLGAIDEANSVLGLARATSAQPRVAAEVKAIQGDLYVMMSDIATPAENYERSSHKITNAHVERLDALLEDLKGQTQVQRAFITPGDTAAGATLDVARTVIRRAERLAARLLHDGVIPNPEVLRYLNRASDVVFVLGRFEEERSHTDG
ncbi:MAG: cob(I)yrinic acid a,c-diamide adenosyltransferase [Chloroflexia bacterium]